MGVEAAYIVKERIESIAGTSMSQVVVLRPGKWSADNQTNLDGVGFYTVVLNLDYNQPYIRTDAMHVELFHTEFDKLQRAVDAVLRDLNRENMHENTALYAAGKAEGVYFQDVVARVNRNDVNDFIEGTDYFIAAMDILLQYAK
jgi:hypothetical protein